MIYMNYEVSGVDAKPMLENLRTTYEEQEAIDIQLGFGEWLARKNMPEILKDEVDVTILATQIANTIELISRLAPAHDHIPMIRALGVYATFRLWKNNPPLLSTFVDMLHPGDRQYCAEGVGYMAGWKLQTAARFIEFSGCFDESQRRALYKGYGYYVAKYAGAEGIAEMAKLSGASKEDLKSFIAGLEERIHPCLKCSWMFWG